MALIKWLVVMGVRIYERDTLVDAERRLGWNLQSRPIVAGNIGTSRHSVQPEDDLGVPEFTRTLERNLGGVKATTGCKRQRDHGHTDRNDRTGEGVAVDRPS